MNRLALAVKPLLLLLVLVLLTTGCTATYIKAMKQFGYETRDLLVDQVKDTRVQQEATREEFTSALDQFKSTFNFDGGDLEKAYDQLQSGYDGCVVEADRLRGEIASGLTFAENHGDRRIDLHALGAFRNDDLVDHAAIDALDLHGRREGGHEDCGHSGVSSGRSKGKRGINADQAGA